MKLSERTLQLLKSFSSINNSILVRPGNIIRTMSSLKSVYVKAEVEETFEQGFAIYDLSRFLGTVSLFSDPDFDFQEKFVTISSGKQRVQYTYADESMIVYPPNKDVTFPPVEVEFVLTSEHLSTINKAGSVLQMPEIIINCDGEVISIKTADSDNPTSDTFSVDVGETDKDFRVVIKPENLKLIPAKYDVALTTNGIVRFATENLIYWVATEAKKS